MTISNLSWQSPIFRSVWALLVGLLLVSMPTVQACVRNDEGDPPITSAPGEYPQGGSGIEYDNAQPIPMPALPDPASSPNRPIPPSTGGSVGKPGSSPGNTGTGKKNPQVLISPKPPSALDPANEIEATERKPQNR